MHIALRLLFILVISLSLSAQGWVSQVVVFGDSLSDTGNFYFAVGSPPSPPWPYPLPKASNGPLSVERMAEAYKVQLLPRQRRRQ